MSVDSTLVELFRHNLWANLRLLEACAGLSDEQLAESMVGSYGRIGDTLVHLLRAEEGYVISLGGPRPERPLRGREEFTGFEELCSHARHSGEALIEIASRDPFEEVLRGEYRGERYAMRAFVPLVQAINHATEHRSQVMTILTQSGIEPPDLSGWAYAEGMGYDRVGD